MTAKIECSACGWRHTVPCGRDDCPHDAATHYHYIATVLDNAVANGCMEQLARMSDEDIAYDLAQHDAYCGEHLGIPILVAGVRAWRLPQTERIYLGLTVAQWRYLSQRFNSAVDLRDERDVIINEWLKERLAASVAPPDGTEYQAPNGKPIDGYPRQQA
jgi:hypothetical protein